MGKKRRHRKRSNTVNSHLILDKDAKNILGEKTGFKQMVPGKLVIYM